MALWKDQSNGARKDDAPSPYEPPATRPELADALEPSTSPVAASRAASTAGGGTESVIGADLAIEGTISGTGNVRLAGRFTGDVTVDGMVTIETGARLAGGVIATTVAIAGELEGNVLQAKRVDILASGALIGDVKAETLTLAAGSRVRGHLECGWPDASSTGRTAGSGSTASSAKARGTAEPTAASASEGSSAT